MTFWTKFAQKEYFRSWTEKVTTIEFCIFELVQVSSFTLNWQLWLPGPNFPKKSISGLERKSDCHLWILHVRITLEVKFHLKLTMLTFWTKYARKGYFQLKTKKVNSIIEFRIFERGYNHFHNILRLFVVLPNFLFTIGETMRNYYW